MIVGVLVELSNKNIDKIFEYLVPHNLEDKIKVGVRVIVPFGKMTLEGFVLEINSVKSTEKELREIINIVDLDVVLNEELLELGKVIQNKTLATLISCYQVMLPKALKAKCGLLDGKFIDANVVTQIANIPSKDVLLCQLCGMLQSGISGLARAISEIAKNKEN